MPQETNTFKTQRPESAAQYDDEELQINQLGQINSAPGLVRANGSTTFSPYLSCLLRIRGLPLRVGVYESDDGIRSNGCWNKVDCVLLSTVVDLYHQITRTICI
jgi:hypothetical protein